MTIKQNENSSLKEKEAFKYYFDTYYSSIRSFLYYKTGDVFLSDDLIQEVFMKLWELRTGIKPDTVKSLLYTIAMNMIRNHVKHQKVVYNFVINNTQNNTSSETADFNLLQDEFNEKLQKVLAEIPEKSRAIFLMNRIDGLKYDEIAERLNLSVKAIEKRMHQALLLIKEKLQYKI
jgi:RNA polymerase sigma-70 factor (family 1)